MKKFFYLISSVALLASLSACSEKNSGKIDFDDLVLDGFYVYGEATGTPDKVLSINAMAAGFNEVTKSVRTGMYEKYIYLEGEKEFSLIENQGGEKIYYGANLAEVNYGYGNGEGKNFENNPDMMILQGELVIGEDAPALKVAKDGLYHIVLDKNAEKDLKNAQIIIQKADFGVRGGCNGWGFTAGEMSRNASTGVITYSWKDLDFAANGTFKFASCNGWKINLDEDGVVKAEVSLAETDGKLSINGADIVIGEKAGLYDVTLTYTPKNAGLADSFTWSANLTKEADLPTECYIIGAEFGNWTFGADGIVSMIPANSEPGVFWAIRYVSDATKGFKFSKTNIAGNWDTAFGKLTTNEGFTNDGDGNAVVAEAGIYMMEVDFKNNVVNIHKAELFGIGDAFDSTWTPDVYPFTVSENLLTITSKAAGDLRMYVKSAINTTAGDWWHREFKLIDGKIVYRGTGGEIAAKGEVAAEQTVALDFNAGTGTIK